MLLLWYLMDIAEWHLGNLDIIWRVSDIPGTVYLTIDDAVYCNDSFKNILDTLGKYNVKATFFVISSYINESNEALLIDAISRGHHLANHGEYNTMHALCSAFSLETEILQCEDALKKLYKRARVQYPKIKYFRPGVGYTTKTIEYVCKKLDYKIVLGTVYPQDAKIPLPNMYAFIVNNKIKEHDVIILHDRYWTPTTLEKTLPYILEKYKIKPIYEEEIVLEYELQPVHNIGENDILLNEIHEI